MLPCHGKMSCKKCFGEYARPAELGPDWKIRNDPGAWGSSEPEILVLGFSKGSTQSNIYENGHFNDVAFGGPARERLNRALQSVSLIKPGEHVSNIIADKNGDMAFGSLVRCSLTRTDKNNKHTCTGALINKSFKEIPQILNNCVSEYLTQLPECTRLVIMLGSGDAYIRNCRKLLASHGHVSEVNTVSYTVNGRLFVHLTHPSPGNGHFTAWINGAEKQQLAANAIQAVTSYQE